MPCYTPLQGFVKAGGGWTGDASKGLGIAMEVACGQCLGCRLDRARMWAMRIIHESSLFDDARGSVFVTLTYDDEHLPEDWSLSRRDWQLFMKRLRRDEDRADGDGVRFFMCGEYGIMCRHGYATEENDDGIAICGDGNGCNVGRPHFHAILFNIRFEDGLICGAGQDDIEYFSSERLTRIWGNGFVSYGAVTMQSAGYVARYAMKKITGKKAEDHYVTWNENVGYWESVSPEIGSQSNRPGIGAKWFEEYQSDVFPSDDVPVPGEGVFKKVPGYYNLLMERACDYRKFMIEGWQIDLGINPMMEEVKERRSAFMMNNKEEFTPERLMAKYRVKNVQVNLLKRNM